MRCNACGKHAPTKYVEFYQNIGAFVMRFSKQIKGNLCKPCINKHFAQMTLTTAAVGWFGLISMILTPIFIINNIARFCSTIGMKSEPDAESDAETQLSAHPTLSLTPDALAKLQPYREELRTRLANGEEADQVAFHVGPRAGVSATQAELFIAKELR